MEKIVRFTVTLSTDLNKRIKCAQKKTPIKGRMEFIRVLLDEALTKRGQ